MKIALKGFDSPRSPPPPLPPTCNGTHSMAAGISDTVGISDTAGISDTEVGTESSGIKSRLNGVVGEATGARGAVPTNGSVRRAWGWFGDWTRSDGE